MDLDHCILAEIYEPEDGTPPTIDLSLCQVIGKIPPFNEYLNVNAPLQIGGLSHKLSNAAAYGWSHVPNAKPFDGVIRNFMVNGELQDLATPVKSLDTQMGYPELDESCKNNMETANCGSNGICAGSIENPKCKCKPFWAGTNCDEQPHISFFQDQSFVNYALPFKPGYFENKIELGFRTWQENGELFRISDQHKRDYAILEITDGHLRFRYNLNALFVEEQVLPLSIIYVNDGQWHWASVERYGSASILRVDVGEGRRYNETVEYRGHMLMDVDKLEGVSAGGMAEFTGVRNYEVANDFRRGVFVISIFT